MPFHITCVCGRLTIVPDDRSGETFTCSKCARELSVPAIDAPLPPPLRAAEQANVSDVRPSVIVRPSRLRQGFATSRHVAPSMALLATSLALTGLLHVVPVVVAVLPGPGEGWSWNLHRWAIALLSLAILHGVYCCYALQLPDWSAAWVVSVFGLVVAVLYAVLMTARMLAHEGNVVFTFLEMDANEFSDGKEAGWCFIMVLVMATFSYFSGRFASRWQRRWKSLPRR